MECEYHQLKGSPARAAVIERLVRRAEQHPIMLDKSQRFERELSGDVVLPITGGTIYNLRRQIVENELEIQRHHTDFKRISDDLDKVHTQVVESRDPTPGSPALKQRCSCGEKYVSRCELALHQREMNGLILKSIRNIVG